MRKFALSTVALVMITIGIDAQNVGAVTDSPASTTATTIGYELSDDFLTLYPGYDDDQYQYLLPDNPLLPTTGSDMRFGIGALALLAFGAIMFVLAKGPRRRRRMSPSQ